MHEAEVSRSVAIHIVVTDLAASNVRVALDGAQVRVLERVHFDPVQFMRSRGWSKVDASHEWRGLYQALPLRWAIEIQNA